MVDAQETKACAARGEGVSNLKDQAQILKEIIGMANPTPKNIEEATTKAIDKLAASFIHSRFVANHKVLPSVRYAVEEFAGITTKANPKGMSLIVRYSTKKNLRNSIDTWVKAWKFHKDIVEEHVKKGCEEWLRIVDEENKQ